MKAAVIKGQLKDIIADAVIVGVYEGAKSLGTSLTDIDQQLDGIVSEMIGSDDFRGKEGETLLIYTLGKIPAKRVLLLGLGKEEDFKEDTIRKVIGKAVKQLEKSKTGTAAVMSVGLGGDISSEAIGQCIVEGAMLASYKFDRYKTDHEERKDSLKEIYIVSADDSVIDDMNRGAETGRILADGTIMARDLINEPSNVLTPEVMADKAVEIANKHGLEVKILEREDMRKLGMGSFLGVTQGSDKPPKLVTIEYLGGDKDDEILGLVGKGLTFDSGGISIKPSAGMEEMKGDMGGAAAVLGAMDVIGTLKPKVNVVAVIGACENMPSGKAYKPGDILTSMAGKTIEVLNTDAEGRLVLVDCITYALKRGATKLVDLATLTGACVIALGDITTGLISNNDEFVEDVKAAAEKAGEKVWRLPAYPEYREQIKSDWADIKNTGGRGAGTITAGLFLGEFVGDNPWVHMDIAGTSMISKERDYLPKGATGVGVRTLYHLIKSMEK